MMNSIIYKIYSHTTDEPLFWFCALVGTGLFMLQFILNFLGAGDHGDIDDNGLEVDAGKFKWLTKQAFTGFFLMFGWAGLTCRKEFILPFSISILIASGAGMTSMFIIAWIFKMVRKLKSTGTIFKIEDAIGKDAIVYQRIPPGGTGKITLSLQYLTHEIDAVSTSEESLPSFISVRIIKKMNDSTVLVIPNK